MLEASGCCDKLLVSLDAVSTLFKQNQLNIYILWLLQVVSVSRPFCYFFFLVLFLIFFSCFLDTMIKNICLLLHAVWDTSATINKLILVFLSVSCCRLIKPRLCECRSLMFVAVMGVVCQGVFSKRDAQFGDDTCRFFPLFIPLIAHQTATQSWAKPVSHPLPGKLHLWWHAIITKHAYKEEPICTLARILNQWSGCPCEVIKGVEEGALKGGGQKGVTRRDGQQSGTSADGAVDWPWPTHTHQTHLHTQKHCIIFTPC